MTATFGDILLSVARRGLLIGLLALAASAPAQATGDFASWLDGVRREALAQGIGEATLKAAFRDLAPIPRIIELDRSQPEFTLTYQEYLDRVVPQARIDRGRGEVAANRALLDRVAAKYGVPVNVIVALWAVESDFGRKMGEFPVVAALATLAYDGRRSKFFRKELMDALHILDEGHITPELMLGSWAGAMGQNQFMPSSFRAFAVDQDGDGRRDIWTDRADVFASIANYISKSGWRHELTWGQAVRLPAKLSAAAGDGKDKKTVAEWQRLGVRSASGKPLDADTLKAGIVMPAGADGPAFLVYDNYEAILRWNRSHYFASAVGLLADQIGEAP
jgi:membrane-bound lytic murein transglycosylase B